MRKMNLSGRTVARAIAALTIAGTAIPVAVALGQDSASKKVPKDPGKFFTTEEPLTVTLTTNIGRIRRDKGDKAPWRAATISYTEPDGKVVVVPTLLRTRGIWRLKNCEFPPLRMDFKRELTKGTVFYGLDKPKLVSFCRDDGASEQWLLQEFQLYRIYGLLTPKSHKVRLLQMTYIDSASGKVHARRPAILLEEPQALAARAGATLIELKGAVPDNVEPYHNALFGVFQYFIGNTDFSIFALHNVELLSEEDGSVVPIPFDFDFSGAVNTRYATTDPKISITRVRDRLFRGYCAPTEEYTKVLTLFNEKKDPIYALYRDQIGSLLRPEVVRETLKYYDDFYKTINDRRDTEREIIKSCVSGR
jgi:hypothetical protein